MFENDCCFFCSMLISFSIETSASSTDAYSSFKSSILCSCMSALRSGELVRVNEDQVHRESIQRTLSYRALIFLVEKSSLLESRRRFSRDPFISLSRRGSSGRSVFQFSRTARARHVSQRLRMQNISFTGKSAGRLRQ